MALPPPLSYTDSSNHTTLDVLAGLYDGAGLMPHLYATFPFSRAAEAFSMSKAGHVVGKVALVPD